MTTMAMDGARDAARAGRWMETAGGAILLYGLVAILLYFGFFKFHPAEAAAIQPLVGNSPLMGWLYGVLSVQGVSNLVGASEIVVALLLLARGRWPLAGVIGGAGATLIFLTTLSFLATTPGAWARVPGWPIPMPGAAGAFLIKDLFLLGAAAWLTGDSLRTPRNR